MKVIEFYDRALTGRRVEEQEFDLKILPGKLKELIKKYDITYNPEEPVPQDLNMARRCFDAAVELLTEVGVYCKDSQSIVPIYEEDIREALQEVPLSHVIGEGAEATVCTHRDIGDRKRPLIIGGPCGNPLSEQNHMNIMTSYAWQPIDGLHTGSIQTLYGRTIKANTPLELVVCQYEALWAREAIRRAGKPGLALLGIMSGVSSEVQDAGDFPGGLRPSDLHLISFSNELKVNWQDLKKIAHNQNMGNAMDTCVITMLGGYCGGPEGTAITAIAEVLQSYVMARPVGFNSGCTGIRAEMVSRQAIWANGMVSLAPKAAGLNLFVNTYVGGISGPCTEMFCEEVAAAAVAYTACGAARLLGATGREGAALDYVGGMNSRILREIAEAAAGLNLSEANEIVKCLVSKYEGTLKAGKAPPGKSFTECYEGIMPSKEFLTLWENKKKELEEIGLKRIR